MTKPLPIGTIVRVIPAHAYDEYAKLNPGGLYMIREVDHEDDCLTYRLGSLIEDYWATKNMIQHIDLEPGSLISIRNIPLEVFSVRNCSEDHEVATLQIIAVNTPGGIKWITEGEATLYGI